jgi:hypothetical protein
MKRMGLFLIIAIIFVGAPIARAIARSIERQGIHPPVGGGDVELKKALLQAEQRLSDSETRIAALEERVDFYEKLLAKPKDSTSTS